jgi:glycosyltransferase involved in cell wall biosynthesis
VIVAYNALSVRPGAYDGATTFTVNLLRYLPEQLADAELVVFARHGEERLRPAANVRIDRVRVRGGALGRLAVEGTSLGGRIRRTGADVLLSPNESLPFRSHTRSVIVAQNLVYHCEAGASSFRGASFVDRVRTRAQFAYYRRRMRAAFEDASAVVAVSTETARLLACRAALDRSRVTVVPEGSDSVFQKPRALDREDALLVVATLAPYKGLEEAIDVLALLQRDRPSLRLDVAGGDWRGYRAVVERHARATGVASAVRLLGRVPPQELSALYSSSRALLHLSSCDAFGLPILEAMRHGLPVVAAARSSAPEVAGGAAVIVEDPDASRVARAIARLLDDRAESDRVVARGHVRASGATWRATAAGIASVVRRVAADSG